MGKTRKQLKTAFPHEGKQEFSENQLSLTREKKETAKNGFPSRGKNKNQQKILSQDWEDEKMWKIGFPKLGKNKKSQRLNFPTLGRIKNTVGNFSTPLDGLFFSFFIHPTPWTSDFSHFPFIRGLGRAVFSIFHSSEASDEHFNAWLSTNPFAVWCSKQSSFLSGH